ncbi:FadR/GntR family transcriptional regulator [Xanthobacter oligotrophicus]|uniref:FadR/GntR family transcriptional regulator n=1 Tax=Xanthobacter oligotrophicus TaxID=2607286 RepID=UPI001E43D050|nr:FadR/GntR family transcriptional regulator [Xanthobacter oligotrophicus]MCG5237991.1 FadR family transcriptional regulator [Xanthobacter oligotrophicus]
MYGTRHHGRGHIGRPESAREKRVRSRLKSAAQRAAHGGAAAGPHAGPHAPSGRASGTLVAQISDTLRQMILSGEFPPGAKLPSEAQLTQAHGVSRTVVREAVAALRSDGLVEARQGAGVFVLDHATTTPLLSFQNVDGARVSSTIELLELRTGVEVEAAGLAAARRSPAQEEVIFERHFAVRTALEEGRSTVEADLALHLAIADATNNPRFREFLAMIGRDAIPRAVLEGEGQSVERVSSYIKMIDEEHQRIVVAISRGDEDAAREAMRVHLRGSQARYRTLLQTRRKHVI